MKSFIIGMGALIFAQSSFAARNVYSCEGANGTTGSVLVSLSEGKITLDGNFQSNDYGEKKLDVDCDGKYGGIRKFHDERFRSYRVQNEPGCQVDQVRMPGSGLPTKVEKDSGKMLALINLTLGDSHDFSGRAYAYFDNCKKVK